jgi:serine/threonine protein kinase
MTTSNTAENHEEKPLVKSPQDLTISEAFDVGATEAKYVTFYLVTPEDRLYFGQLFKSKKEITPAEYHSALEYVPDSEIYPMVPETLDNPLTIAPDALDDVSAFIKRPGINSYEEMKGSDFIPKGLLQETIIMEQLSKAHHPHIIRYHGCRVRRDRIICIFLERLDQTLMQYSHEPEFAQLDRSKFLEALELAVAHLHSLGLAHNDINPHNIMVRDGMPVLIDFGACQPLGRPLQEAGSPGWCMDDITTSELEHDRYGIQKVREWLETGKLPLV